MSTLELKDRTVFGVALNYQTVLNEHVMQFTEKPYLFLPKKPVLFIKTPNTYNLSGKVVKPAEEQLQAGPTLAVVIGKKARRVALTDALQYVAGVVVGNEFSLPEESFYRPAIKAKCRDGFMALSETIIPLDQIKNINKLALEVAVNGEVKQTGNTGEWVRDLPTLITEITEYMTLDEGDILLTGTPAGRFDLAVGDTVTVTIEGVGQLTTEVIGQ